MNRAIGQVAFEQRIFWRNRSGVFFTFVFPLLLFVLLTVTIGATADGQQYVDFLVPGIVAMAIASTAFQTLAIQFAWHRELGILRTFAATPLGVGGIIAAKIISVALVTLVGVCSVVALALLAFSHPAPADIATFAGFVVLGTVTMAALGMAAGTLMPSGDSATAIANAVYLPLVFVSGVFAPVEQLPGPVQAVAAVFPLQHLVDPLRASYLGEDAQLGLATYAAVLATWTVAATLLAIANLRWEPRESAT